MLKGTKETLKVLRREDRGQRDDPQFSPYYPSQRFIVFYDYGHPADLGSMTFKTKTAAEEWIMVRNTEGL